MCLNLRADRWLNISFLSRNHLHPIDTAKPTVSLSSKINESQSHCILPSLTLSIQFTEGNLCGRLSNSVGKSSALNTLRVVDCAPKRCANLDRTKKRRILLGRNSMNRTMVSGIAAFALVLGASFAMTETANAGGIMSMLQGKRGCSTNSCGLFSRMKAKMASSSCCAPEPTCCEPEPACCAPEPAPCCAPEPAPASCCAPEPAPAPCCAPEPAPAPCCAAAEPAPAPCGCSDVVSAPAPVSYEAAPVSYEAAPVSYTHLTLPTKA